MILTRLIRSLCALLSFRSSSGIMPRISLTCSPFCPPLNYLSVVLSPGTPFGRIRIFLLDLDRQDFEQFAFYARSPLSALACLVIRACRVLWNICPSFCVPVSLIEKAGSCRSFPSWILRPSQALPTRRFPPYFLSVRILRERSPSWVLVAKVVPGNSSFPQKRLSNNSVSDSHRAVFIFSCDLLHAPSIGSCDRACFYLPATRAFW